MEFVSLLCVGMLWGCTNPFIKSGSKGIKNIKETSKFKKNILEFKFLIINASYLLPLLLNQLGSILFVFTLHDADLSLAVPISNSLAFLFTAITGYLIGEDIPSKNVLKGSFFVLIGSTLLMLEKL